MSVLTILKMGDPRLLRVAQPVTDFDTDALHLLVSDLLDTMRAASGAAAAVRPVGRRPARSSPWPPWRVERASPTATFSKAR